MTRIELEYKAVSEECGSTYYQCRRCKFWTEDSKNMPAHLVDKHFDVTVHNYAVSALSKPRTLHFNQTYPCWVGTNVTDFQLTWWLRAALRGWNLRSPGVEGVIVKVSCRERQTSRYYCCFCGLESESKSDTFDHILQKHVSFKQDVCKRKDESFNTLS
jgi:hypothetical protein